MDQFYTMSALGGNAKDTNIYVIKGGGLEVHISAWGATITKLLVPDADGVKDDVVLGFDSLTPYQDGTSPYFGAIVGRVANRIAGATFQLGGKRYSVTPNERGNCLHGGARGFDKRWWKAEPLQTPEGEALRLTYTSLNGEEGFPGNMKVVVTYTVATYGEHAFGDASLITTMEAVCDQPTPVSLAQHTYWNLGGHGSGSVLDHSVRIAAREYTPVGDDLIPTGELVPVQGTPFDFLRPRKIREEIEQVPGGGYDHNYVLSAHGGKLPTGMSSGRALPVRLAATVVDGKSRRGMDVLTDAPGMQFYTGNFLDQVPGKSGVQYGKHAGLCLETQGFPNAVNTPTFPNVVLLPGETYSHTMVHRFYCTY